MRHHVFAAFVIATAVMHTTAPAYADDIPEFSLHVASGNLTFRDVVFRCQHSTGAVWYRSSGDYGKFILVQEATALPRGDYRCLVVVAPPLNGQPNGWNFYRWDARSGQTWALNSGTTTAWTWIELTAAK